MQNIDAFINDMEIRKKWRLEKKIVEVYLDFGWQRAQKSDGPARMEELDKWRAVLWGRCFNDFLTLDSSVFEREAHFPSIKYKVALFL